MPRPTRVDVDLDAIAHNVAHLSAMANPAGLCAVVKADAYGHGDVPVAETALAAGARRVAVATVGEGVRLREAGIDAPILLLADATPDDADTIVRFGLTPSLSSPRLLDALGGSGVGVEVAVDTGMHRGGVDPTGATALAEAVRAGGLAHLGTWSHLAVADEDDDFTALQVDRFSEVLRAMVAAGYDPGTRHLANSAGLLHHPATRLDEVRVGLAMYGLSPDPARPDPELRPALSVRSRLVHVTRLPAGSRPSYGRVRPLARDGAVGVVPIGYADGYPRGMGAGGPGVLVAGRTVPLAGRVTMDQVIVDLGDVDAAVGDEVVLLGIDGEASVTADDWAAALGTISWEVVARLGARLPRRHHRGPT